MTSIKAFIRTSSKKSKANVRFRLRDGRNIQLFHKSNIGVDSDQWDAKKECYKAKCVINSTERENFDNKVANRKQLIASIYNTSNKEELTSAKLDELIDEALHPEKHKSEIKEMGFFDLFNEYLEKRKLSEVRDKNFRVLIRALKRYELFISHYNKKNFKLDINTITSETIDDIESFLRNEHNISEEHPNIYKEFPAIMDTRRKSVKPQPRGNNTICALFNKLRAFFNWCNEQEKTTNKPFAKYEGVTSEKYGTPFYINLDERNQIADFDLSEYPPLAAQRDIFIFQCLIGCRVSDLLKMTEHNIMNGAVEYIPRKTKEENPTIVQVPLNERAEALVAKYKGKDSKGRIFPFISAQKYNDDIKDIFRLCGITRSVTILNPTTGKEEKRPINEVASSHMARRTFIGNLYKKVKDPNLVGALSGHKEGSKAFARYREIDRDIKNELVKMLE